MKRNKSTLISIILILAFTLLIGGIVVGQAQEKKA